MASDPWKTTPSTGLRSPESLRPLRRGRKWDRGKLCSPSPVVFDRSRAIRTIIPATLVVHRSMVKRREVAEKPGGCWRRETVDQPLLSSSKTGLSSTPRSAGRRGRKWERQGVGFLCGQSSNFYAPPPPPPPPSESFRRAKPNLCVHFPSVLYVFSRIKHANTG